MPRYYCEPCFGSQNQLIEICQDLTTDDQHYVKLEYYFQSKYNYSISIFQIYAIQNTNNEAHALYSKLNQELQSINEKNSLKYLKNNELSFPQSYFKLKSLDFIPLQICSSIPFKNEQRLIFNFSNEIDKEIILKNFENFVDKPPFTHFLALPISPLFPDFVNAFKTMTTYWGINQYVNFNLLHITLGIFLINNDDELNRVNQIIKESINQIKWPFNENILKISSIDAFSRFDNSTVFFKPFENLFTQCLFQFVKLFLTKMQKNGFAYIDASQVFHVTFLRNFPNDHLNMIRQSFNPNYLPQLQIQEFSLVQRNAYDSNGFYKTIFQYSLFNKDIEDTNECKKKIVVTLNNEKPKKLFIITRNKKK